MSANFDKRNVVIVLSTYNGARYISEQVESLQNQTYPHWILLIRDDCSTDETMELIQRMASSDGRIVISESSGTNIGVVASFSDLLETALLYNANYYFLCDQDDVWHETKIEQFVLEFKRIENELTNPMPVLVHSDLAVVDISMETISPSLMEYQKIRNISAQPLQVLLSQNFVTGCATAINRELLQLAVPMHGAIMHDWWLALLASATGKIGYIDKPTVAYRQHGNNTVGAIKIGMGTIIGIICSFRWISIWKDKQQRLSETFKQATHIAECLKQRETGTTHLISIIDTFAHLAEKSPLTRVWIAVYLLGIRKIGFFRNIFFVIQLLFVTQRGQAVEKIRH